MFGIDLVFALSKLLTLGLRNGKEATGMQTRWVVAMLVGLALLSSQAVSLTISGLKLAHVTSAYAADDNNQGDNDAQGENEL